jgi:hypothetical protein
MKMQPDRLDGVNVIARHEPGCVWVNATAWDRSVIVPWRGAAQAWGTRGREALAHDALAHQAHGHEALTHEALTAADFERLLDFAPELVIFGSGSALRFVAPVMHRSLFERRIGVETMDTAAACRTYNVLATEGRSVVAALLV